MFRFALKSLEKTPFDSLIKVMGVSLIPDPNEIIIENQSNLSFFDKKNKNGYVNVNYDCFGQNWGFADSTNLNVLCIDTQRQAAVLLISEGSMGRSFKAFLDYLEKTFEKPDYEPTLSLDFTGDTRDGYKLGVFDWAKEVCEKHH